VVGNGGGTAGLGQRVEERADMRGPHVSGREESSATREALA
jgi:hypothetical protein